MTLINKKLCAPVCTALLCVLLTACSGQDGPVDTAAEEPAAEKTVSMTTSSGEAAPTVSPGDIGMSPKDTEERTKHEERDDLQRVTGRYLKSTSGDGIIVIDNADPVVFFDDSGDLSLIHSLSDGDLITMDIGSIKETYPAQTDSHKIELVEKGSITDVDPYTVGRMVEMGQITERELTPMVYLNDRILISTGKEAYVTCGTADGSILFSTEKTKMPSREGESNFGSGASYIHLDDGAAAVMMDQKYILFLDSDTVEYDHSFYRKSELSAETLAWLEFYSGLSEEGKKSISMVPPEFVKSDFHPVAMETDAAD